ncbi:hypothetical protein B0H13DRAFT_2656932 [Mycena leptocephala]|nr:hypothetical protein B0H13DRAFT_2656932 [Mycena leptocephala]
MCTTGYSIIHLLPGPQDANPTLWGNMCIDVTDGVESDGTKLQSLTIQWNGTDTYIDLTDGNVTDGNVLQFPLAAAAIPTRCGSPKPFPIPLHAVNHFRGFPLLA